MPSTQEDLARLLVTIELSQAKTEKQAAAIAAAGERAARKIDGDFRAANQNIAKSFDAGGKKVIQSLGAQRGAVTNLSFQLNDIATQLSSGTSFFQVMAQQGGQVVQSLTGAGGVLGALKIVSGALFNPFTLATLAITGVAAASAHYFSETSTDAKEATKKIEEHRQSIKAAIDAWGSGAPAALVAYNDELERLDKLEKQRLGLQAAISDAQDSSNKILSDFGPRLEKVLGLFQSFPKHKATVEAARDAWAAYAEKVKAGTATAEDSANIAKLLNETIAKLPLGPAKALAADFGALAKSIDATVGRARALTGALEEVGKAQNVFPTLGLGGPVTSEGGDFKFPATGLGDWEEEGAAAAGDWQKGWADRMSSKDFLRHQAASEHISSRIEELDNEFADKMAALLRKFPEIKIVSATRTTAEQQRIWDSGVRPAARPGTSRHERGGAMDLRTGGLAAERYRELVREAEQLGLESLAGIGDPGHFQMQGDKSTKGSTTKVDSVKAFTAALAEQTSVMSAQRVAAGTLNVAFDEQVYVVERAKLIQEGLNIAKRDGIAASPAEVAAITAAADARAREEAAVKGVTNAQRDLTQSAQQFNALGRDLMGGFIADLRAGKSAAEAFSNVLDKVVDKLIDVGLNMLFPTSGVGGLGGGGGLLGGMIIPGILHDGGVAGRDGYGHGRSVSAAAFAGARRYHGGSKGIGGLRSDEVPAILQRGEMVIPKGGSKGSTETIRVVLQDDSGRMAAVADRQIQTRAGTLIHVAVQRSVKTVQNQLPSMMGDAQVRHG